MSEFLLVVKLLDEEAIRAADLQKSLEPKVGKLQSTETALESKDSALK